MLKKMIGVILCRKIRCLYKLVQGKEGQEQKQTSDELTKDQELKTFDPGTNLGLLLPREKQSDLCHLYYFCN